MSAFFGQEFLTAQYFRPNYLHGAGGIPPAPDGHSGYWRLFFYNMQEEALNAEKKKTAEKVDAGGAVVKESVAKKETPRKRPRGAKVENSLRAAEPQTEAKSPAFRLAPAVTGPSVYEQVQQLVALDPTKYTEARHNSRERITKQRKQRARRRAAAFLLLAA